MLGFGKKYKKVGVDTPELPNIGKVPSPSEMLNDDKIAQISKVIMGEMQNPTANTDNKIDKAIQKLREEIKVRQELLNLLLNI